jgi:hypothetical protein
MPRDRRRLGEAIDIRVAPATPMSPDHHLEWIR